MDKTKIPDNLLDDGIGYLLTSQAIDHGISWKRMSSAGVADT
jgi:hypothetical protein